MFKIRVNRTVRRSIDDVFMALTEHARYTRFKGISVSNLLQRGRSEMNGVGAVRHIESGLFKFREVITEFERPNRFAYHIEWSKPLNISHELGLIELNAIDADQTEVLWRSEGRVHVPVVGRVLIDPLIEKQLGKAFASMLKQIEQMDLSEAVVAQPQA